MLLKMTVCWYYLVMIFSNSFTHLDCVACDSKDILRQNKEKMKHPCCGLYLLNLTTSLLLGYAKYLYTCIQNLCITKYKGLL